MTETTPSIPRSGFATRLAALRDAIERSALDGLLVTSAANIRYLTGFSGSSAHLLVLRDARATLLTDFRYEEQAEDEVPSEVRVRIATSGLTAALADQLEAASRPRRLGFEAKSLTVHERQALGERCGRAVWEEGAPAVERLREVKAAEEITLIERAIAIAETALARTLEGLEEGLTEIELAARLEFELRTAGSERLPFETIVASGPRSSLPHAQPSGRVIGEGDLVLFDFGATFGGYVSDITRTVVLGDPAQWQQDLREAVREAQRTAIEAIEAGVSCVDIDRAARRALEERGLADRFGHSTGHGIGLEVHEAPSLSRRSEDRLAAGHVVTVEPGVYLPGQGGIRIEDDVLVTDGGARILSGFPRSLEINSL